MQELIYGIPELSIFVLPAIILVLGGGYLATRRRGGEDPETQGNYVTWKIIVGVMILFAGMLYGIISFLYLYGLGGGGRSSANIKEPQTQSGKICKQELLTKYQCKPFKWAENVKGPPHNVFGVCGYRNKNQPRVIFREFNLRVIDGCNYRFRCEFENENLANSELIFSEALTDTENCIRDRMILEDLRIKRSTNMSSQSKEK